MDGEKLTELVREYCRQRDIQIAAYEVYARKFGLTAKELLVLGMILYTPENGFQSEIGKNLTMARQTVSAIIKKFVKLGYVSLKESKIDHRNKAVKLTAKGREYAEMIIPPAVRVETDAMAELSEEDAASLIRITRIFSEEIRRNFENTGN